MKNVKETVYQNFTVPNAIEYVTQINYTMTLRVTIYDLPVEHVILAMDMEYVTTATVYVTRIGSTVGYTNAMSHVHYAITAHVSCTVRVRRVYVKRGGMEADVTFRVPGCLKPTNPAMAMVFAHLILRAQRANVGRNLEVTIAPSNVLE
jgi:hypothetical protein